MTIHPIVDIIISLRDKIAWSHDWHKIQNGCHKISDIVNLLFLGYLGWLFGFLTPFWVHFGCIFGVKNPNNPTK